MEKLVEYIARYIVTNPDQVYAQEIEMDNGITEIQLTVAEEDLGRIIGRRGAIAKNIRTVLRAISLKKDTNYTLKIVEND